MKPLHAFGVLVLFLGVAVHLDAQTQMTVWKQFVADLKQGKVTTERIRPYKESLRAPLMGYLSTIREKASREELDAVPEVHQVGNRLHYLLPLTLDGEKATYCFTFVTEGDQWYFQHLDSIFIRLDRTAAPPVSTFPDVPEAEKARIREEIDTSAKVQLFAMLAKEKGRDFAFDWFKDGYGYLLAARVWVPFLPPSRAFILYACWEQANLRGNRVTLEKLDDTQAIVRMDLRYFKLYQEAAHLPQQISFADYRRIFETVWQDRAKAAGWNLTTNCTGAECVFNFRKAAGAEL